MCEECENWRTAGRNIGRKVGKIEERNRIINRLIELGAIRRDALGHLVAFNTDGTEVIYLDGLENPDVQE